LALSCPKLEAEKARAEQRERLTAKITGWHAETNRAEQRVADQREKLKAAMNRAAGELAKTGPVKPANSDAVALASYLSALGLNGMNAERLNGWLVLLTILCVEMGSGVSLSIAMALSGPAARSGLAPTNDEPDPATPPNAPTAPADQAPAPVFRLTVHERRFATPAAQAAVRNGGGLLRTTTRRLGVQLGRPAATIHGELRRLAAVGLITLNADSRGTLISAVPTAPRTT
jgi:hypothetical protein